MDIQPKTLRELMIKNAGQMGTLTEKFDKFEEKADARFGRIEDQVEATRRTAIATAVAVEGACASLVDVTKRVDAVECKCAATRETLFGNPEAGKRGTIQKLWLSVAGIGIFVGGGTAEAKTGILEKILAGVRHWLG